MSSFDAQVAPLGCESGKPVIVAGAPPLSGYLRSRCPSIAWTRPTHWPSGEKNGLPGLTPSRGFHSSSRIDRMSTSPRDATARSVVLWPVRTALQAMWVPSGEIARRLRKLDVAR